MQVSGQVAARAVDARKVYGRGDNQVTALAGVSVEFRAGEFTAIMGPSGSGKSTLMHCMAGLDQVSSGATYIGDTKTSSMSDRELTVLRRERLGFVFQSFNLVPTLSAEENIVLPLSLARRRPDQQWFDTLVSALGIAGRLGHRPSQLSGGQQQRVAVARALVGRPEILFGDEPTGNLDSNATAEVLRILREAVDEWNQTVVVVTHDPDTASYADRVVLLADGMIAGEITAPTRRSVLDAMASMGVR